MLTSDKTIEKEVVKIISKTKHIRPARVRAKANLSQDFGFDPIDVVDIILELEKNFHITIPDEVPIDTVGDFINYLTTHTIQKVD
ncbi:acyl carrier protein [Pontibacter qinzhouensis]|uniref:Acyl carrier protein n=1 Tax=Pontibacter qinzhouensis TaxID=2603253 RepID=A0A5C8K7N9_9BACT|nr:phosphopantetheine-binding protein [Pontibacter qinzhouensis]TXK47415.1 acyl carrier protein [Pontibacter qinzhouensis]